MGYYRSMSRLEQQRGLQPPTDTTLANANSGRNYQVYSAAMDAAELYKAELIFPHIQVCEGGVIADIGSGTGALAEHATTVFSHATVYAVDQSHELMDLADDKRALINLLYGDALTPIFERNSLDAAYSCSCGHEIESFAGPGSMHKLLLLMCDALKPGANFVLRDFAKPDIQGPVYMLLSEAPSPNPSQNGNDLIDNLKADDYCTLSEWQLFFRFHQEFGGGNAFKYEITENGGQSFIKLDAQWAYEFYMRKDYRINWNNEIRERYGYWTLDQAKEEAKRAGFDDVKVIPEYNKFIETTRLTDKVALFQANDHGELKRIEFPPSHMTVVMTKSGELSSAAASVGLPKAVDYAELIEGIKVDFGRRTVDVGELNFKIETDPIIRGSKRYVFYLSDTPGQVLKIPRTDGINVHNCFKAMHQAISRQEVLDEYQVPYVPILEFDRKGPPYRYLIQEALPKDAQCAADLALHGHLSETDIKQMAQIINHFERERRWQLDTNPFNWYRVTTAPGETQMVYADLKVYKYDERWSFARVGLLQWLVPDLLQNINERCAKIPTAALVQDHAKWWDDSNPGVQFWKKHLLAELQP